MGWTSVCAGSAKSIPELEVRADERGRKLQGADADGVAGGTSARKHCSLISVP